MQKPTPAPTEPAVAESPRPVVRTGRGTFAPGSGRPRKRQGGGTLGNLNAVKNPWESYWKRRALKPQDRWALQLVRDYVPSLVADKGGPSEVSFGEMKVIELAAVARVCWSLALTRGDFENVGRFIAHERAALVEVGLARRAKPVPSIEAYIAEKAAERAATGTEDAES